MPGVVKSFDILAHMHTHTLLDTRGIAVYRRQRLYRTTNTLLAEVAQVARTRPTTLLAAVMDARRITQTDLEAISGVSRPTINLAYHGEEVSLESWIRLAEALAVPVGAIAPPTVAARIASVA
jgi:hypothetical protein